MIERILRYGANVSKTGTSEQAAFWLHWFVLSFSIGPAFAVFFVDNSTNLGNGCNIKSQRSDNGFLGLDWAQTWENSGCQSVEAKSGTSFTGGGSSYAYSYSNNDYGFSTHYGFASGVNRNCQMFTSNSCS